MWVEIKGVKSFTRDNEDRIPIREIKLWTQKKTWRNGIKF